MSKQPKLSSTRRLTYLAMLIALSAVGANLKIPSIIGTPAFDSLPAFLGGLLLGPATGAVVAALGHMLTALTAGFPLTLPIHLLIAAGMAGIVALFAVISRLTIWGGAIAAILLNGIAFPALFILIPSYGTAFFFSMIVPLLVASLLNVILAELLFIPVSRVVPANYLKLKKAAM